MELKRRRTLILDDSFLKTRILSPIFPRQRSTIFITFVCMHRSAINTKQQQHHLANHEASIHAILTLNLEDVRLRLLHWSMVRDLLSSRCPRSRQEPTDPSLRILCDTVERDLHLIIIIGDQIHVIIDVRSNASSEQVVGRPFHLLLIKQIGRTFQKLKPTSRNR